MHADFERSACVPLATVLAFDAYSQFIGVGAFAGLAQPALSGVERACHPRIRHLFVTPFRQAIAFLARRSFSEGGSEG